jgi:hypothetical protein
MAARADLAVREDEMPRGHPLVHGNRAQERGGLRFLKRNRSKAPAPVPPEHLREHEKAEAAVGVVQDRQSGHAPNYYPARPAVAADAA